MSDTLLRDGTLLDGTGAPPVRGDVLVVGDRIAEVGRFAAPAAALVIDCAGLAVAPGFIDAHSHADLRVFEPHDEKVRQGITTEIVGNCGFSAFPAGAGRLRLHEFAGVVLQGNGDWGWPSAEAYLDALANSATGVNVRPLVGHGTLRIAVAGSRHGPLSAVELDAMERMLEAALDEGACGLSTGLRYLPSASAPFEELERLCRVVARHDALYAARLRSYQARLPQALDEQLELARRTGCRLQISHFQAAGPANWPKQARALEQIELARRQGIDVAFDCYPYTAGAGVLTELLPQWALEGGVDRMCARLSSDSERSRIAAEITANLSLRWTDISISGTASWMNRGLVGKSIAEIAAERQRLPLDVVLDLLVEEHGRATFISFTQSDENLKQAIGHPFSIVTSDGLYVEGLPHPQLYGAFPRLLGHMVRDLGWLTLPQAVHKITAFPAQRFGLERRGRIERGFFADLVVFEPENIHSPATYENPQLFPAGIRYVFRNGKPIVGAMGG